MEDGFQVPNTDLVPTLGADVFRGIGWDVELVCATRGESGNRGALENSTESTGDIRQKELEKSIKIVGIRRITFLGFKDTLMPKLAAGELEESIYKVLKERNPNIVITFEPNGVTNHPDHKRLTVATTYAFQKYTRRYYYRFLFLFF